MLKKNEEEQLYGYEKELDLPNVPASVAPYLSIAYGNRKEIERLLSFKLGIECKNKIMDLVDDAIMFATQSGVASQKEKDYAEKMSMQSQLDRLIKKDGKASKERKMRVNA